MSAVVVFAAVVVVEAAVIAVVVFGCMTRVVDSADAVAAGFEDADLASVVAGVV